MSKFNPFAHLMGNKAKASEDDEKTRKAKGRRAEDDDDEENAENDDPESEDHDDEKEGRKAKKAKSKKAEDDGEDPDAEDDENAEGDDEDAEDDEDNKDVKKGRRAERKRCARIFGSKAAAARPDMAAHLAFNTRMSSSEAISTLKAMGGAPAPQSNRRSLDARMREEEQVRLGQDAEVAPKGSAASLVNKMTNLYNSNKGGK
ncbi:MULTISPECIES: hypothetical protein [Providencia]|uniref:DNA primase n=1 Tax=Providencia rettgeri TaxID=587 RepID=A0AB35L9Q9_PRORE|nr:MULTISPECIES: hypothetical protein [Providencia]ELR5066294.1 hypothetical protein [Providencia rettgeri]MBO8254701.1 hypothetical protein [Providencia rettgeri]MBO8258433.1 hypothetical protein [Providencia rettgeri]MDE4731018.1 hypothetical protein [Providencia rettgeri]MDH2305681.1 hypothetical protein [Providencia rettgeri]